MLTDDYVKAFFRGRELAEAGLQLDVVDVWFPEGHADREAALDGWGSITWGREEMGDFNLALLHQMIVNTILINLS